MRDLLIYLQHRRRPSDEAPDRAGRHLGGRFSRVSALFECPLHDARDLPDDERFADVVERAGADRFDGGLECAEAADQHNRAALVRLEAPQEIDP